MILDLYQKLASVDLDSEERRKLLRPSQRELLVLWHIVKTESDPELVNFAADLIVYRYMRLIVSYVKPYVNKGIPMIDLIAHGVCGIKVAITKFDPNRGMLFTTFSNAWVLKDVRLALQRMNFLTIPGYVQDELYTIRKWIREKGEPEDGEELLDLIIVATGCSPNTAGILRGLLSNRYSSLDEGTVETIGYSDDVSNPSFIGELDPTDESILDLLHGLSTQPGKPMHPSAVARKLGLTAEYVIERDRILIAQLRERFSL